MNESISWLLLERYHLDEVSRDERAAIEHALEQDPGLRHRLESLEQDTRALPPLPLAHDKSAPRARRWPWLLAPLLAATAALALIVLRPIPEARYGVGQRPSAIRIKGGTLALSLVRERGGVIEHAPRDFDLADRFKLRLTCPPAAARIWDAVIFQGGEAFFPLGPRRKTACGNRVVLPGAFRLDGARAARICVMVGDELPAREALRMGGEAALPESSVCAAPLTPKR